MWEQLTRIYDALGSGSATRKGDDAGGTTAAGFVANKVNSTLGLADLSKFLTLLTGDLSKILAREDDGPESPQSPNATPQADKRSNEPSLSTEMANSVRTITQAVSSIPQVIEKSLAGSRSAASGSTARDEDSGDGVAKAIEAARTGNDARGTNADRNNPQLDRIGDLLAGIQETVSSMAGGSPTEALRDVAGKLGTLNASLVANTTATAANTAAVAANTVALGAGAAVPKGAPGGRKGLFA